MTCAAEEEGGEGPQRRRGNEAGMRVSSFQDVRDRARGQRGSDVCVSWHIPLETGRAALERRSRLISSQFQPGKEKEGWVRERRFNMFVLVPPVCYF